jgi:hypothetical protein
MRVWTPIPIIASTPVDSPHSRYCYFVSRLRTPAHIREGSLKVGLIIPDDCPKQTLAGRRKRLRVAMDERLDMCGWKRVKKAAANTYQCELLKLFA